MAAIFGFPEFGNEKIAEIANKNAAEIGTDTLCDEILNTANGEVTKEWDINGEKVTLSVERV